jgi:ABC-2 type transport system permease protein
MFMLSGALFPIDNIPAYLGFLIQLNPLTYGVDLMRYIILGSTSFGLLADIAALILSTIVFIIIGTKSFEKMQV